MGIVTDRDVCCRSTADSHDPKRTAIALYITRNPITCLADDLLDHCLELLHKHGIRLVPVLDKAGQCVGIVAPPDIPEKPEIVVRRELARAVCSTVNKFIKSLGSVQRD